MGLREVLGVVEILREKCPWDAQQTLFSLRYQLLEEVYEFIEAVERDDKNAILEEIGDLLNLVLMFILIAEQEGMANREETLRRMVEKLKYKHPHIFSDKKGWGMEEVLKNWETTKKEGVLSGVDTRRPALVLAHRIGEKVSRVGFDWDTPEEVLEKVKEEFKEFLQAEDKFEELGDLLFTLAQFARKSGYYAEDALRFANTKFINRFKALEEEVKRRGKSLKDLSLDELNQLWEEVKTYS